MSALSYGVCVLGQRIDCNLSSLVDSKAIDIEHGDQKPRKSLDFLADRRNPLPETALDRAESGQLTLPYWDSNKSSNDTIL